MCEVDAAEIVDYADDFEVELWWMDPRMSFDVYDGPSEGLGF